jgi:hypothetical protein
MAAAVVAMVVVAAATVAVVIAALVNENRNKPEDGAQRKSARLQGQALFVFGRKIPVAEATIGAE